jgi:hypothetical protein
MLGATLGVLVLAGCHSAEEKSLAKERVDLLKQQAALVEKNPDCTALSGALLDFEKANSSRITTFNTKWKALPESKRESLMKPHRDETNPYFKAMIAPLIKCGTVFPVK